MDDEFVDVPGACAIVGISRATLMRALAAGEIPAQKIGRNLRLKTSDLRAYEQSRLRYRIQRYSPPSPLWTAPISDAELPRIVSTLQYVLERGGAPVNSDGLKSIILGAIDPLFWRALSQGVEVLRDRDAGVEKQMPERIAEKRSPGEETGHTWIGELVPMSAGQKGTTDEKK